jgi:hypothetical protein
MLSDGAESYTAVPLRLTLTEGSERMVGGKESILGGAELGVVGRETGDGCLVLKVSNAEGRPSRELRSFDRLL